MAARKNPDQTEGYNLSTEVYYIRQGIEELKSRTSRVEDKLDDLPKNFVTNERFAPYEKGAFAVIIGVFGYISTSLWSLITHK